MSQDPKLEAEEEEISIEVDSTFSKQNTAAYARSTHLSFKFVSRKAQESRIGRFIMHYEADERE